MGRSNDGDRLAAALERGDEARIRTILHANGYEWADPARADQLAGAVDLLREARSLLHEDGTDNGVDRGFIEGYGKLCAAIRLLEGAPSPMPERVSDQPEGEPTMSTMPVFTIKGKDVLAQPTLRAYAELCESLGLFDQARETIKALNEIRRWQNANRGTVKIPDHTHVPADPDA